MGEETILIASRFTNAVAHLAMLGRGDHGVRRSGPDRSELAASIRAALDAVEAVYAAGTDAVRDWPEQSRRVLAQIAAMRRAIDEAGVDGEVCRMARALVDAIAPAARGR